MSIHGTGRFSFRGLALTPQHAVPGSSAGEHGLGDLEGVRACDGPSAESPEVSLAV